jgi:predicted site-specific integrase-resolvase
MAKVARMAETIQLLTSAQVAELLGKSVATINRWATAGRLKPAAKAPGIRGAWLFAPDDVEKALRELPAGQASVASHLDSS